MSGNEAAERPSYWAVLPAPVRYDAGLPPSARLLYAEISSLTEKQGYCYASNGYFQALYSLSERTVIRLLRALEAGGYIRIEANTGGKGVERRIYAGINPLAASPDKNISRPRQKCQCNPDKNVSENNKADQERDHPPIIPPRGGGPAPPAPAQEPKKRKRRGKLACDWEPLMFERFWHLYPRGEDKTGARYEWDMLQPDLALMRTMSSALKRQILSEDWQKGVGIPWAARWLKERRWEWVADMEEKASASKPEPDTQEEAIPWT